jgi:hypothetical protein
VVQLGHGAAHSFFSSASTAEANFSRLDRRLEAADDLAVAADQELGAVFSQLTFF